MNIPGQVDELQLKAIEAVAALVPAGGIIVEVGSLFGRSSWAWAQSAPEATVYCVDPWVGNRGVRDLERIHGVTYGLEAFENFTQDCANIHALKGFSPTDFLTWHEPVDLYYEDAVHVDPVLSSNLEFWISHLREDGIVCGDDFRIRFPDVVKGAHRYAESLNRELSRVGYFWCLLPSRDPFGNVARVKNDLAKLSRESIALHSSEPFRYDTACHLVPGSLHHGGLTLTVQVTNLSPHVWPLESRHGEAKLVIEGGPIESRATDSLAWQSWITAPVLLPDAHHEEVVRINLPEGATGEWSFSSHLQIGGMEVLRERRVARSCVICIDQAEPPTLSRPEAATDYLRSEVRKALGSGGDIAGTGLTIRADKLYGLQSGSHETVRSMLEPREIALLHMLTRDYYQGSGYIIDAGSLLGASTLALASGLRASGVESKFQRPIQSFDLFQLTGPNAYFVAGFRRSGPTPSGLDDFLRITAPYADLVSVHQGDIQSFDRADDPVEILFNDLSKTVALSDFMVSNFFTCMIPGKSIIVQPDYVHFAAWWIAATMEHFKSSFVEMGYYYGATKLFLYVGADPGEFTEFSLSRLGFEELERLIKAAIERAPVTVSEALVTALGMFYIDCDMPEQALATVLPLKLDQERMDYLMGVDVEVGENFAAPIPSYRRRVIRYAQEGFKTLEA